MALFTNILVAKRGEFILCSYNNSEIFAFPFCSWFCSLSSFRLSQSAFPRRHFLPSLLRFLDIFLRCFFLLICSHLIYLLWNLCNLRIHCNCSGPCEKDPNLRCLRVLRTRKHLKFGNFLRMAE